ncbi:putative beta-lactamase [Apodospora peruviana]|uniref:Beta-lactamase n=1 Tax=Apodospora peruviana TaxID=516989 RepID=A0AAE0HZ47_9PEZI|nr:putative beta-lactamase [Apodospora peruviana]
MASLIRNIAAVTACIIGIANHSLAKTICPRDVLCHGTPESVGMLSKPLHEMVANLTNFTEARSWGSPTHNQVLPVQPGGAVLIAHDGVIVSHFAFGKRRLWASVDGFNGTLLPPREREDATIDTIYDMASLTKMFTTVAALRCIDRGLVALNGTVASYLPKFATNGKEGITIVQLMTHTSGLAADPAIGLWMTLYPTYEARVGQILNETLRNTPGSTYLYSDINYMTLMLVIEKVTGKPLDKVIYEYTSVMGMKDTFFNRGNIEGPKLPFYNRIATQEFQIDILGDDEPQRPQPIRGTVHDENGWGLDGVSGHAGLFSTVLDTARFCQMILNNGTYGGKRILSQESVDLIFTNLNARFGAGNSHGVGFELNQYYTAGPMANPLAASHTGYTGTSMVIDRASDTLFLHFANRVHPSRSWSSNNIVRETVGAWVATALGRTVVFP